jgi:hypothetical protein
MGWAMGGEEGEKRPARSGGPVGPSEGKRRTVGLKESFCFSFSKNIN